MSSIVGASTGSIDVQGTVDKLVEVEYTKRLDPIDEKITRKQGAITAVSKLKAAAADLEDKLAVLEDTTQFSGGSAASNLSSALKNIVTSYNSLQALVKEYGTTDPGDASRDTAAEVALYGDTGLVALKRLMSDGLFSGIADRLATSTTPANKVFNFSNLGLTRKIDGTVTFSQKTFDAVSPTDIAKFATGLKTDFRAKLATAATYTGLFQSRTNQLNSELYTLKTRRQTVYDQISAQKSRWLSTYSQLNTTLQSLGTTSSYLTAQLKSLQSNNNS